MTDSRDKYLKGEAKNTKTDAQKDGSNAEVKADNKKVDIKKSDAKPEAEQTWDEKITAAAQKPLQQIQSIQHIAANLKNPAHGDHLLPKNNKFSDAVHLTKAIDSLLEKAGIDPAQKDKSEAIIQKLKATSEDLHLQLMNGQLEAKDWKAAITSTAKELAELKSKEPKEQEPIIKQVEETFFKGLQQQLKSYAEKTLADQKFQALTNALIQGKNITGGQWLNLKEPKESQQDSKNEHGLAITSREFLKAGYFQRDNGPIITVKAPPKDSPGAPYTVTTDFKSMTSEATRKAGFGEVMDFLIAKGGQTTFPITFPADHSGKSVAHMLDVYTILDLAESKKVGLDFNPGDFTTSQWNSIKERVANINNEAKAADTKIQGNYGNVKTATPEERKASLDTQHLTHLKSINDSIDKTIATINKLPTDKSLDNDQKTTALNCGNELEKQLKSLTTELARMTAEHTISPAKDSAQATLLVDCVDKIRSISDRFLEVAKKDDNHPSVGSPHNKTQQTALNVYNASDALKEKIRTDKNGPAFDAVTDKLAKKLAAEEAAKKTVEAKPGAPKH